MVFFTLYIVILGCFSVSILPFNGVFLALAVESTRGLAHRVRHGAEHRPHERVRAAEHAHPERDQPALVTEARGAQRRVL